MQINVRKTFNGVGANRVWRLRKVIRDDEMLNERKDPTKLATFEAIKEEKLKKIGDTHMIVAALIVTITFTAGFTVPGNINSCSTCCILNLVSCLCVSTNATLVITNYNKKL